MNKIIIHYSYYFLSNNILFKQNNLNHYQCNKFNDKNMRKINPKSSDIDSFKYSILISLHYYDISFHPERILKLKPFENKYNFINITPNEFEINNLNISLTIFDENNKRIYMTESNSTSKSQITKLKNNRYAALKPLKNKFIKLDKILASFSHIESREHIQQNILKNKIDNIEITNN